MSTYNPNAVRYNTEGIIAASADQFTTQSTYSSRLDLAHLYPVLSGEIMAAYYPMTKFAGKVDRESIVPGGVEVYTEAVHKFGLPTVVKPGDSISERDLPFTRIRVALDADPHALGSAMYDIDEILSQNSSKRAQIAVQLAESFAQFADREIAKLIALAARKTQANTTFANAEEDERFFHFGGNAHFDSRYSGAVTRTNAAFGAGTAAAAEAWLDVIDDTTVLWQELDVPDQKPKFVACNPADWQALRDHDRVTRHTGAQYNETARSAVPVLPQLGLAPGIGEYAGGLNDVITYKGFQFMATNNLPSADLSTSEYRAGDYSATKGLIWSPECVKYLEPVQLGIEMDRKPEKMADFIYGHTLIGGGTKRGLLSVEVTSS